MTVETKAEIGLSDLSAIIFHCCACGARITLPLGRVKKVSVHCPDCDSFWLHKDGPEATELINFIRYIERMAKMTGSPAFEIKFEVSGMGKKAE